MKHRSVVKFFMYGGTAKGKKMKEVILFSPPKESPSVVLLLCNFV
jgi:hypothetical protein